MKFAGKVAVVTGSGRAGGLGEAISFRLSQEGATVVISDIGGSRDAATPDAMIGGEAEMQRVMASMPGPASTFTCDVRSPEQVQSLAKHAVDNHGSLDIWVNNAGIGYIMKPMMEVTPDEWRAVIDVNLTGAFFGLQAAAGVMIGQGRGGRIINIASQAAKSGFLHAQAYTSSKHGLVGLVRSASVELGPFGITVNNVCPNHVTTGLGQWQNEHFAELQGITVEEYLKRMAARIPLGRPGLPSDTAAAVTFLCSDDAGYITGESMNVSGGEEPH